MRPSLVILLASIVSSAACARQQPQESPKSQPQTVFPDQQAAAQDGLNTLKNTVDESNYQSRGFKSAVEVKQAVLGEPASLFLISNEKVANFKPGVDVRSLLEDDHRMVFPVLVNGEGRTLITIAQTSHGWTYVGNGDGDVAQNLARIRNDKMSQAGPGPGSSPSNYYDIRIQALDVDFLATDNRAQGPGGNNDILLTPLSSAVEPVSGSVHSPPSKDNPVGFYSAPLALDKRFQMYLRKNPQFTPEGEASKPATDVLGALTPAAKKVQAADGPG
jgi:hypothetical protein